MPLTSDRLMTVPEVAAYLRLSPASVYTSRYRGQFPGALGIQVGRKIVFRRHDLDAYLDDQAVAAREAVAG